MNHFRDLNLDIVNKTILEFGSGVGHLTSKLLKLTSSELILSIEARESNILYHKKRFPETNILCFDLESDDWTTIPKSDIGIAFGILYHLKNPFDFIKNASKKVNDFLIIETAVCDDYINKQQVLEETHSGYIVKEDVNLCIDSYNGMGCRMYSNSIILELKLYFPYVYSVIPPDNEEFTSKRRQIFMGSYIDQHNNQLIIV